MATPGNDEYQVSITGDSAGLTKATQGAEATLRQFANSLQGKLGQVSAFRDLQESITKTGTALDGARNKVRDLANELSATATPSKKLQDDYRMAVAEATKLERQMGRQEKQAETLGAALKTAGLDTRNLAGEQARLATEIAKSSQAIDAETARTRSRRRVTSARDILGLPDPREVDQQVSRIEAALKRLQATGTLTMSQNRAATEAARLKIAELRGETETTAARMTRSLGAVHSAVLGLGAAFAFHEIIKAVTDSERVTTLLEQKLRSTGRTSEFTAEQLQGVATQLERISTVDDDAIAAAETALLGFRNVKPDIFLDTTKAVLDLSAAFGTDLTETALKVGKALDNPTKAAKVLREVYVTLTNDQQRLIKKFIDAGDAAAAQRVILDEIARTWGGTASAAANTLGGALAQVKAAFGNLLEGDGGNVPEARDALKGLTATLQDPQVKEGMAALVAGLVTLTGWLAKAASGFAGFGGQIARFAADITGNLAPVDRLTGKIEDLNRAMKGGVAGRVFGLTPLGRILGFGGPISQTFKSDKDIEQLRIQTEAERDKLTGGAFAISGDAQQLRIKQVQDEIAGLTLQYDTLFGTIKDGSANASGSLAQTAEAADKVKRQIEAKNQELARLQQGDGAASGTGSPAKPASKRALEGGVDPEEAAKAQQEARAKAAAESAAASAIFKAGLQRNRADLEFNLQQNLIGYREYYAEKLKLDQQAIDDEIKERQRQLPTATAADQIKLNGEIKALQQQREALVDQSTKDQYVAEKDLTDKVFDLQNRLLDATGHSAEARAAAIKKEFDKLILELRVDGDEAGIAIAVKLKGIELAKAEFDDLQQKLEDVQAAYQRRQQEIDLSVQTGARTRSQAQRDQINAAKEAVVKETALADQMQRQADIIGDPALQARIAQLREEIAQTGQVGQEAFNQIAGAIEDDLGGALTDFLDGTKGAKHAFTDFLNSVEHDINAFIAKKLSQQLVDSLFGAFKQGGGGGGGGSDFLSSIIGWGASLFGGGASSTGIATSNTGGIPIHHQGGRIGSIGPKTIIPPIDFARVPRAHTGARILKPDEVPIVGLTGERVLNREETTAYETGMGGRGHTFVFNGVTDMDSFRRNQTELGAKLGSFILKSTKRNR